MGIFDFLKDNGVNKDIEKRIKRKKVLDKAIDIERESQKKKIKRNPNDIIYIKGNESVEDLIAKVDKGENQKKGSDIIIMIKLSVAVVKPKLYMQFVNRMKIERPNLYSKYLHELGVNDFETSFMNHLKKLLINKENNIFLFILFFPFKFTWVAFSAIFGGFDKQDGEQVAGCLIFFIWAFIIYVIGMLSTNL